MRAGDPSFRVRYMYKYMKARDGCSPGSHRHCYSMVTHTRAILFLLRDVLLCMINAQYTCTCTCACECAIYPVELQSGGIVLVVRVCQAQKG